MLGRARQPARRRFLERAALGLLAFLPLAAVGEGDPARGAQSFVVCGACHASGPDSGTLIGPTLWNVVGRKVAARTEFDYSEALRRLGGEWTAERLDRFLANPADYAPGTRMAYVGIPDPVERRDVIAYLGTLTGGVAPVAAAADPFGPNWPAGPGREEAGAVCNACHSLAIVKQQRLPRARWDKLLDWMVEEQGMPEQPPERRALILEYLATHFGQ